MTDPYRGESRTHPRRRWVLPTAIVVGATLLLIAGVVIALVIRPGADTAAPSPTPSQSASASASASAKPAAAPSPRIRIDCERVLTSPEVTAFLGTGAVLRRDAPRTMVEARWLQSGGLGCTWNLGDASVRVTALPLDVDDQIPTFLRGESADPSTPLPTPAEPRIECNEYDGCVAYAASPVVAIAVSAPGLTSDSTGAFRTAALAALDRVGAITTVESAWTYPGSPTVRLPADCAGIDSDAAVASALGRPPLTWGGFGGDGYGLLENSTVWAGPWLSCAGGADGLQWGAPIIGAIPGSRWAWTDMSAWRLSQGANPIDVAGAESAVISTTSYVDSSSRTITLVVGDAVMEFSASAQAGDDAAAQAHLVAIAEAWIAANVG